jgi:dihydroorotate dehydrogenase electron transfer subunit
VIPRLKSTARVLSNRKLKEGIFLLELEAPEIARRSRPGQFVMIRPQEGNDPLLPRPFSLHDVRTDNIRLLYRLVGSGTKLMAAWIKGQACALAGPLGRGFKVWPGSYRPLLVAGGMGLAPMPFLYRKLFFLGLAPKLLYGCRSKKEKLPLSPLRPKVATDDGSCGRPGLATMLLEEELIDSEKCRVYACGPWAMLKQTALICREHGVPCQVSLESRMACGLGACQGCAVRAADGSYLSVCSDGPVFDSRLIDWDQEPLL